MTASDYRMSEVPNWSPEAQLAVIGQKVDALTAQVAKVTDDHEFRIRKLEQDAETPEERKAQNDMIGSLLKFKWVLLGAAMVSPGAWFAALSRLG